MNEQEFAQTTGKVKKYLWVGLPILLVLALVIKSFTIIETGNVGVKSTLGQIQKDELKPGPNFVLPYIQKIEPVFTKTVMVSYSGGERKADTEELNYEGTLRGEDKTGLEMGIDMIVEVNPQSDKMADMFIEVGRQGFDKKVLQPIRGAARKVLGQFNAESIMSQRKEVEVSLRNELEIIFSENPYYKLENIQLKKIYLPQKVKDAIERVQLAKQEAKANKEKIQTNKALAQSKVELAKGEAEAVRQMAQAAADKITIEAAAQAKANQVISDSLTEKLLKQNHIDAWKAGGSKVPHFISGGQNGSSMFLIDTKTK